MKAEVQSLQHHFPERVGQYELLLPIGTGGMATVYWARKSGVGGFERDVALKLVHAHLRSDEESKLQLLEEAKLAARIRHPNVVPVLEVDEDPVGLFLVMDYVEGESLSGLVKAAEAAGEPLSRRLVARILNDALLGLQAAHELKNEAGDALGLVHRDFSPQNILISVQGVTRLTDFGVAKAADRAVRTKTGLVKGKVTYMAPEQARGHAIDRRCDVWAAGVVAWELIAQRRMHEAEDDVATLLRIVTEQPPLLSEVVDVHESLDKAVASALTPEVAQRCSSATQLRQALERAFNEGDGMADVQELAEFTRRIIGPKLLGRSRGIAEIRASRNQGQHASHAAVPDSRHTDGSATTHHAATPSNAKLPLVTQHLPSSDHIVQPDPGVPIPRPEELTQTSAVLPSIPFNTGSRRWAIVLGVLAVAVTMALFALTSSRDGTTEKPPITQVPAATTGAAAASAPPLNDKGGYAETEDAEKNTAASSSVAAEPLNTASNRSTNNTAIDSASRNEQRSKQSSSLKAPRHATPSAARTKRKKKTPVGSDNILGDNPYTKPKSGR